MAFNKCASCGQIYMSKVKLAEHVAARHSEKTESLKTEPEVGLSKSEVASAKYAKLAAKYAALNSPKTMISKVKHEPGITLPEENLKSFSITTAPENPALAALPFPVTMYESFDCFVCNRKLNMSHMPMHIVRHHLSELKQFLEDCKTHLPWDKQAPIFADAFEEDVAYVLGEITRSEDPALTPRFVCPCCKRSWNHQFSLKGFTFHVNKHIRRYAKKSYFQCPVCLVNHSHILSYKAHCSKKHIARCKQCPLRFISFRSLRDHVKQAHPHTGTPCPHPGCGQFFALHSQFLVHEREVHFQTLQCPFCFGGTRRYFASREDLQNHIEVTHSEKSLSAKKCRNCGKIFETAAELVEHRRSVHFRFECKTPGCGFRSKSPSTLAKHSTTHLKFTSNYCARCQKSFRLRHYYVRHLIRAHRVESKTELNSVKIEHSSTCNCIKDEPQ